jgi:hypothetical protein
MRTHFLIISGFAVALTAAMWGAGLADDACRVHGEMTVPSGISTSDARSGLPALPEPGEGIGTGTMPGSPAGKDLPEIGARPLDDLLGIEAPPAYEGPLRGNDGG